MPVSKAVSAGIQFPNQEPALEPCIALPLHCIALHDLGQERGKKLVLS